MRWHNWLALAWLLASATIVAAQQKPALPEGAVARLGMSRLRLPEGIVDTGFTPDGRTFVVISGKEWNAVLFDVATGRERKRIELPDYHNVAIARTRPLMVVVTTKGFEVWDLATEKLVKRWPYPALKWRTSALAISPDGTEVVAVLSQRDTAAILRWDAATGQALPARYPTTSPICALSFSSDGSKLLTASLDKVVLVKGKYTTVPGSIAVWDCKTGKKLAEQATLYPNVLFSPDGRRFARGTTGKSVEIIDIGTAQRLAEFAEPHGQFAFSPDSKRLVIVSGGEIRLWDIDTGKDVRRFKAAHRLNGRPRFSADGRLLAIVCADTGANYVQFWDVASGKQLRFTTGHPGAVGGLAFSPNGRQLATFSEDVLLIFDVRTGAELQRWVGHQKWIAQIAFSPDGKLLASASADGTIGLWDAANARLWRRLTTAASVRALAFTLDGTTLIALNNGSVQCRGIKKGVLQHSYEVPPRMVFPAISPSGQLLAWFDIRRRTLQFMNVRTGKSMPSIDLRRLSTGEFGGILTFPATAVSSDGRLVATCDSESSHDHAVRVWETATRKEILRLAGLHNSTRLLAISPDGRMLAHGFDTAFSWSGAGADTTVILRDIATGQSVFLQSKEADAFRKRHRAIGGHHGSITCLAFSPDSKLIATGGSDQVVYLWRVSDFFKRPNLPEVNDDVAALWPQLAHANAGTAYQAIAQLERKPKETVALLRKHLRPVPMPDAKVIARHLRDLESVKFRVRQQAHAALEKAGEQAAHLLQEALKNSSTLELKRRLQALLEKLDRPLEEPGQIRVHRCLVVLERIGTPEARNLLTELSQGAPAAWLTTEARHALTRLDGQ